jgi:hypothetical protein
MFQWLLHTVLIVTMFSCPLRCTMGPSGSLPQDGNTGQQVSTTGCSCCASTPGSKAPQSSEGSHSDGACFCLCAGAILVLGAGIELQSEQVELNHVVSEITEPASLPARSLFKHEGKPAHSSGRAIRIYLMSLSC